MSEASDPRLDALEARIAHLEAEVDRLGRPASGMAKPPPPPPPPTPGTRPVISYEPRGHPRPERERRDLNLNSETILKWGGVALVVLAVGFAVSTAISRGWIGPELQLTGAIALSLALIGVGWRLRPTRLPWTHALCSGGVAALFATAASNLFIDQTSTDAAYASTLVVGLLGFALARFIPSEWVGLVTLAGGVTGWLVIGEAEPPFALTATCLALGFVISLALSIEREWFGLRLFAHVIGLVGTMWLGAVADTGGEQAWTVTIGAAVAISLLSVPSRGSLESLWQQLEVQLAAVLAPWVFMIVGMTFEINSGTAAGSTGIAAGIAVALVAVAIRSRIRLPHFVSLLLGASVAFSIGVAAMIDAEAAFVAIALQGAGLVVLARTLEHNIRVYVNAAVLLLIGVFFVLIDGIDAWSVDTDIGEDLARLGVIVAVGLGIWFTKQRDVQRFASVIVLGLFLIWLGSVLVHLPEGQAAVSVSWAIVGTTILVAGAIRKIPDLGTVGLAVIGLTVAKLLVVDMQEVDTLWRAGLFLVVGLGIMRLGFLLPRLTGAAPRDGGAAPGDGA